MRPWADWYRILIVVWVLFGLPALIVGYGFSGGEFELPPAGDLLGWVLWLLIVAFLISPIILWPMRKGLARTDLD